MNGLTEIRVIYKNTYSDHSNLNESFRKLFVFQVYGYKHKFI